jgi:hypothetical protein
VTLSRAKQAFTNFYNSRINYFFTGRNYLDLEFGRIVFFTYLFNRYYGGWHQQRFLRFHDVPSLFWQPVSLFKFIPLEHIYLTNNISFYSLLLISYVMSAIGLFTRIFIPIAFITSYIVIGFPNNFGTIYDSTCMVTVVIGLLCFSNAGQSLSIDSLIKGNKKSSNTVPQNWFLNFTTFLIMFFYFCSSIQKIRYSGAEIFTANHVTSALIYNGSPYGHYLSQFAWAGVLSTFATLILQTATVIPLFIKKYILPFSLIFLVFHLSVDLTMGKHFNLMKICYVFIFPWSQFLNDITSLFIHKKFIKISDIGISAHSNLIKFYIFICLITLFSASFAVFYNNPIWPFSTTTMYAFPDKLPFKQKDLYLTGLSEYKVTNDDLFPISKTKVRISIDQLLEEGHSIEKIAKETQRFINTNVKLKYDHLEIRECTYNTIDDLRELYPNSKDCEVKTRLSF